MGNLDEAFGLVSKMRLLLDRFGDHMPDCLKECCDDDACDCCDCDLPGTLHAAETWLKENSLQG